MFFFTGWWILQFISAYGRMVLYERSIMVSLIILIILICHKFCIDLPSLARWFLCSYEYFCEGICARVMEWMSCSSSHSAIVTLTIPQGHIYRCGLRPEWLNMVHNMVEYSWNSGWILRSTGRKNGQKRWKPKSGVSGVGNCPILGILDITL